MRANVDFTLQRRSTVTMQVHADLRARIIRGELPPRGSISENEIAERYGVSRTPAREVLGRLEEEGLVEIYPQYGSFIAPIRVSEVRNSQFVRECLECAALAKAVQRLTSADADRLRANIARQTALVHAEQTSFVEADEEMHAAFFSMAGYRQAWAVVAAAKLPLDRVRFLSARKIDKRQSILSEHKGIVDSLLAGDAEAAVSALQQHLRGVFASIDLAIAEHPDFFLSDQEQGSRPAGKPQGRAGNRGTRPKSMLDRPEKSATKFA